MALSLRASFPLGWQAPGGFPSSGTDNPPSLGPAHPVSRANTTGMAHPSLSVRALLLWACTPSPCRHPSFGAGSFTRVGTPPPGTLRPCFPLLLRSGRCPLAARGAPRTPALCGLHRSPRRHGDEHQARAGRGEGARVRGSGDRRIGKAAPGGSRALHPPFLWEHSALHRARRKSAVILFLSLEEVMLFFLQNFLSMANPNPSSPNFPEFFLDRN